ncbi:hypothetical protein HZC33_01215 [Candidatus Wolfebacteria bacterium]|nr:hypothetical protein [Candidatus Wolfebacteria bacterium]
MINKLKIKLNSIKQSNVFQFVFLALLSVSLTYFLVYAQVGAVSTLDSNLKTGDIIASGKATIGGDLSAATLSAANGSFIVSSIGDITGHALNINNKLIVDSNGVSISGFSMKYLYLPVAFSNPINLSNVSEPAYSQKTTGGAYEARQTSANRSPIGNFYKIDNLATLYTNPSGTGTICDAINSGNWGTRGNNLKFILSDRDLGSTARIVNYFGYAGSDGSNACTQKTNDYAYFEFVDYQRLGQIYIK